jgi:hypothetical protein
MGYTVVALDPGRTTGHATGYIDDGLMKISAGQTAFSHIDLYSNLRIVKPDFIVCELFEFRAGTRARTKVDLYPCELMGVVSLYGQQSQEGAWTDVEGIAVEVKECIVYWQKPSAALGGFYTDAKLKKDGLYKALKGGHSNDAVRHLLQWYTFGPGYKYNSAGYEPA